MVMDALTPKVPFTDEQRKAYVDEKKRQREELGAKVRGLVDSFRHSDTFKDYLAKMNAFSRACAKYLHRYSPQNVMFILAQDPNARIVGSYNAWRKIGRHVARGEHPRIQVWAPIQETLMQPKRDEDGNPVLKPDGTPELEPMRDEDGHTLRRFNGHFLLKPVYDISQTDGEPLPELAAELRNPVEHFDSYMKALKEVSPLPIHLSSEPEAAAVSLGDAKGACSFGRGMIVVKDGMSQEHTLKTTVHEIAHALLHDPGKVTPTNSPGGKEAPFTREEKECQAEGTAYVVCDHFGLDTSDYSIPYIMSWGEDERLSAFNRSLSVILDTANDLIDRTETVLWKEMGIDEARKGNREKLESSYKLPAIHESSMFIGLEDLLGDPALQSLISAGYEPSIDTIDTAMVPLEGVCLTKDRGLYELRIEVLPAFEEGTLHPGIDFEKTTTAIAAYDKTLVPEGNGEPFFERRFDRPLKEQMGELRENEHYLNLSALAAADFRMKSKSNEACVFAGVVQGRPMTIEVPIAEEGGQHRLAFERRNNCVVIHDGGMRHTIRHVRSVPRALEQASHHVRECIVIPKHVAGNDHPLQRQRAIQEHLDEGIPAKNRPRRTPAKNRQAIER